MEGTVRAAGTLPWRLRKGKVEVAMVHRPRYDDWAWAKGKLDPGEEWAGAAVRETFEETGLVVRLGRPLPTSVYDVGGGRHRRRKEVRYWAAEVIGGDGTLENEIDEVRWLTPARARSLATYSRDLEQLDALVSGPLRTRPLAVVRHAHAVPRKEWQGENDQLRPLSDAGRVRAEDLVTLMGAYALTHVVSSPSTRCADTVLPYTQAAPVDVRTTWREEISEEGFEADPHLLSPIVADAIHGGEPVALCSHGPVLGTIFAELSRGLRTPGAHVKRPLKSARAHGMTKGEVFVLHVSDDPRPTVVAVERHVP